MFPFQESSLDDSPLDESSLDALMISAKKES